MEDTVLDPLLTSKKQVGSAGEGGQGSAACCQPSLSSGILENCREDPGNKASTGAHTSRTGKSTPSVGRLICESVTSPPGWQDPSRSQPRGLSALALSTCGAGLFLSWGWQSCALWGI